MSDNSIIKNIKNNKINKALKSFNQKDKKEQIKILKKLPDQVGNNLVLFWINLIKSKNKQAHKLTKILIDSKVMEDQISDLINHDNKNVRRKAVLVLGKKLAQSKLDNIDPLIKALEHKDLGIKSRAMVALSKGKVKKALPALEKLLKKSFADVQKKVIKTIYEIGGKKAKEILINNQDKIDSDNKNVLNKYLSQLGYSLREDINKKIKKKLENNLNIKNHKYIGLTIKGLEKQAISAIQEKVNIKVLEYFNGKIIFQYKGDIRDLRQLKCLSKVYLLMSSLKERQINKSSLKQKLNKIDISFLAHLFDKKDKFAFFINLRKLKTRNIRPKLKNILTSWLKNKNFVTTSNNYNLEAKTFLHEDEVLIGFNLVGLLDYKRKWRKSLSSTALKPHLSYLLVYLSGISKTDVFLDPMCGSGSIMIERALAGDYKKIIGSDKNKKVLNKAKQNIKNINKNIKIYNWDATNLPLGDNSINKIVVDMPFGIRSGDHNKNVNLYTNFLKEAKRVLMPNSKLIILSQEISLLNKSLNKIGSFKIENKIRINFKGLKPMIFALRR